LNNNQISGIIPESIGNLVKLAYLYTENNNLTGTIPESFQKLTNKTIDLSENFFFDWNFKPGCKWKLVNGIVYE